MPNTNNNLVTPNNLFALENEVMKDLTDFNKKDRLYLTCDPSTGVQNQRFINKGICTGLSTADISKLKQQRDDAYKKLTAVPGGSLVRLQDAINYLPETSGGIDQRQYLENYYAILRQYKDVVGNRQDLDAKLAELYEIGDTSNNFYQKKLISTSYTKILLTVLATTLTISAFMVMRNK
jgi:hypothetical protein